MQQSPLTSERIQHVDPSTGIKVIQLTSFPSPSIHFNYNWPSVTPDNARVLFYCQRWAGRSAPWDVFRCDSDGIGLIQLTETNLERAPEWHHGIPRAIMTLDGKRLYASWPGEDIVYRVDVETGDTERVAELGGYIREGFLNATLSVNHDETKLYADIRSYELGDAQLLSIDLNSGEIVTLETDATVVACFPDEPKLLLTRNFMTLGTRVTTDGTRVYNTTDQNEMEFVVCDEDFGNQRPLGFGPPKFAHSTLLGRTGLIQGTGHLPDKCIWIADLDGGMRKLCEGPYFWHSGASLDGEWIVSDTNWPDEGLHLIHVPTGHFRFLCRPEATQDHSQFGHPHPALSQDGRIAVFASDRTGVTQVYAAHIPDSFREDLADGNTASGPKWF